MAASQGEHAKVLPGTLINSRYAIIKEIGCGNFSKVYECKDTKAPTFNAASPDGSPTLALKILKREYANDAAFERDMLKVLAAKDTENSANVSKMFDQFVWNRYPCFVMPLRGPTLRSRKFGVQRGHCTRAEVVRLCKSLLKSMKFVHFDCKMVHTDLKPENILLNSNVTHLGDDWTICDFGSASLWRVDRMDSDLISTRPYRAPEVVLGNPWSYPADMWSIGCIVFEAAHGSRLFDVHDDNTHLHYMQSRLGPMPEAFTKRSKHCKKYFDSNGNFLRQLGTPAAGRAATAVAASNAAPRAISEILKDDALLLDLLSQMLAYDPAKRIRADHALEHPLFHETTSGVPTRESTPRAAVVQVHKDAARASPDGAATAAGAVEAHATTPTTSTTAVPAAAVGGAHKYRALPPLINALNAISLEGGPSPKNSAAAAAAKRPIQGLCRTPEELKRAPLSAQVRPSKPSAAPGAHPVAVKLSSKFSFSGMPASAANLPAAEFMPKSGGKAILAAGKESRLGYFGR